MVQRWGQFIHPSVSILTFRCFNCCCLLVCTVYCNSAFSCQVRPVCNNYNKPVLLLMQKKGSQLKLISWIEKSTSTTDNFQFGNWISIDLIEKTEWTPTLERLNSTDIDMKYIPIMLEVLLMFLSSGWFHSPPKRIRWENMAEKEKLRVCHFVWKTRVYSSVLYQNLNKYQFIVVTPWP